MSQVEMYAPVPAEGDLFARIACCCGKTWDFPRTVESLSEAVRLCSSLEYGCDLSDCRPRVEVAASVGVPPPIRADAPEREMKELLRGDPCAYCGRKSEHLDHIVPRSGGGDDDSSNLTAACAACNLAKRAEPLLAFLAAVR